MAHVKIAVVGAGSFVFGPAVLTQTLLQHRLDGVELALVDPDTEMVQLMAGVGRRMASDVGIKATITAHSDRLPAFEGADFVVCSAARQVQKRFGMDVAIVRRLLPTHHISEFGGVPGISYSLRQIALIQDITADMKLKCPKAWLLDAANPLPRVCQAAHEEGIRTAGFCSASIEAYMTIWRLLVDKTLDYKDYPWTPASERWDVTLAGLNHLCFVIGMRDRATGRDMLGDLRQALAAGARDRNPLGESIARKLGYLLGANDHHYADFLEPDPANPVSNRDHATHGTADMRVERLKLLADIAAGNAPMEPLTSRVSWERPGDVIAAIALGKSIRLHSLNLINDGQMPQLPAHVFVETAATATPQGPVPDQVTMPESVLPLLRRTAQVTDAIVRAARQRSRKLVYEAVEIDPTIFDKPAARMAIDECMAAHADILPAYS